MEELHRSSLTQPCLNAGYSVCHRPHGMEITQLRDPTTFLLYSQGLANAIYPPRRKGFPCRGEEDFPYQDFHASAESQSLQTAARVSLHNPCLCLGDSALLISGPWSNAPSVGYWEAALAASPASQYPNTIPSTASPVHHRGFLASQIHLLIQTPKPRLCSAEHCSKAPP